MQMIHAREAKGLKDKIIGLLVKNKPQALLFRTRFGIHTFGMRFPIDVVILNKENRVVTAKRNIKPNSIFFWNPRYDNVLELPAGTINNMKLQVGDELAIRFT